MSPSVWTQLDHAGRSLAPFALTLLIVIAGAVPLQVPGLSPIVPQLGLISVYFWAVHRPDLMPAWAVFLLGLIQDLLGGGPLGVGVLVLLLVRAAVTAQHRFLGSGSFLLVWAVFLLVAAAAFLAAWLLSSAIAAKLLDAGPALFQYLTTAAFYPCIAWFFAQAQRSILR